MENQDLETDENIYNIGQQQEGVITRSQEQKNKGINIGLTKKIGKDKQSVTPQDKQDKTKAQIIQNQQKLNNNQNNQNKSMSENSQPNNQQGQSKKYDYNTLGSILQQIYTSRGNNVIKQQDGQFTTDSYGLRVMNENYMKELKQKRDTKAASTAYSAIQEFYNYAPPSARNSTEVSSQLIPFANALSNEKGQWVLNGQITSFKKLVSKLSDIQKRSPIILLMKRIVQLKRAKQMVISYIQKQKSIAKSEMKAADPDLTLLRQYNAIKNNFKKMRKDNRLRNDPNYKMQIQFNKIEASRNKLLGIQQNRLTDVLKTQYDKQIEMQKAYQSLSDTRKKLYYKLDPSMELENRNDGDSTTQQV